jgi:membrane protease YdiL (CAAX protease family)
VLKRHAVLAYFILTFAISWGVIIAVFGIGPIPPDRLEAQGPFLYIALLAGPSVAGLVMTGLVSGRSGFSVLRHRLCTWRVNPGWYAFGLLAAPSTLVPVLIVAHVAGWVPNVFTTHELGVRLFSGFGAGLAVALFEETGWTGFAVPRLRERYGVLVTGLIVGLVWGLWHFPPFWDGDTFAQPTAFGLLFARLFTWLPAFRACLVWLHDRTGSLLVVVIMHASLVATQFVLIVPFEFERSGAVVYIIGWGVILWLAAAILTRIKRPE